MPYIH